MKILTTLGAFLTVLAFSAACSGGKNESQAVFPIAGNSELVVGANRFAVGLIDKDNRPVLGDAGTTVHLRFLLSDAVRAEQDATFVWAIPDVNGFWTADVDFDQAGNWSLETDLVRGGEELGVQPLPFAVLAQSQYPNVGDAAPPSENLTLATESNIKRISTDPNPDTAFYEMTITQALAAGKPFVVTFATPAFCQTRFCGPVVDNVKAVRPQFAAEVNFIHIEPFVLTDEGALVEGPDGGPAVAAPMDQWRLRTEPWVFVVDADGRIASRFEGAASTDELTAALEAVLS